ncbi:MAG: GNAT family N-acetyltransferase [Steroidobacteraceae bacterium]
MTRRFDPQPIVLQGERVRLEPLSLEHLSALFDIGRDPALWTYLPCPAFSSAQDARQWIEECRAEVAAGRHLAFVIVVRDTGRVVGSTRYIDIQREHRTLEIGWTLIAVEFQRTFVNTETKFLLLSHAFETLDAVRVALSADSRNLRSRQAIERIGGVREGVLRCHRVQPDGYVRDTVCYSIVAREWPRVRGRLEALLRDR